MRHKKTGAIALVFSLLFASSALAKPAPVCALPYVDKPALVGKGRLSYAVWDVYDAWLHAPDGKLKDGRPFALTLSYLRKIDGRKIADTSAEEMRRMGMKDEVRLALWHQKMRRIFPDVDKGISLTGVRLASGETVFCKNGEKIGKISDRDFGRYFFNIWLGEETKAPDLRRKLIGQGKQ